MSEMIERVAESLWQADSVRAARRRRLIPWEAEGEEARELWRFHARAAIEAMREPTQAMIKAGYDWDCAEWPDDWSEEHPGITPEWYRAKHIFPAMIDAALEVPAPLGISGTQDEERAG